MKSERQGSCSTTSHPASDQSQPPTSAHVEAHDSCWKIRNSNHFPFSQNCCSYLSLTRCSALATTPSFIVCSPVRGVGTHPMEPYHIYYTIRLEAVSRRNVAKKVIRMKARENDIVMHCNKSNSHNHSDRV